MGVRIFVMETTNNVSAAMPEILLIQGWLVMRSMRSRKWVNKKKRHTRNRETKEKDNFSHRLFGWYTFKRSRLITVKQYRCNTKTNTGVLVQKCEFTQNLRYCERNLLIQLYVNVEMFAAFISKQWKSIQDYYLQLII